MCRSICIVKFQVKINIFFFCVLQVYMLRTFFFTRFNLEKKNISNKSGGEGDKGREMSNFLMECVLHQKKSSRSFVPIPIYSVRIHKFHYEAAIQFIFQLFARADNRISTFFFLFLHSVDSKFKQNIYETSEFCFFLLTNTHNFLANTNPCAQYFHLLNKKTIRISTKKWNSCPAMKKNKLDPCYNLMVSDIFIHVSQVTKQMKEKKN